MKLNFTILLLWGTNYGFICFEYCNHIHLHIKISVLHVDFKIGSNQGILYLKFYFEAWYHI